MTADLPEALRPYTFKAGFAGEPSIPYMEGYNAALEKSHAVDGFEWLEAVVEDYDASEDLADFGDRVASYIEDIRRHVAKVRGGS